MRHSVRWLRVPELASLAGRAAILAALMAAGHAQAFESKPLEQQGGSFFLNRTGGLGLDGKPPPALAERFRILPYASVGGETFALNPLAGLTEGPPRDNFGIGASYDRSRFEPRAALRGADAFTAGRGGAFFNYLQDGAEWGRLAVTTGIGGTGAAQGFDIRAMRRFGLADGVSLSFGPTLSFGEYERFGLAPQGNNGQRLTAAGAGFQLERELSPNLRAAFTANYSMVQPIQGSAAPLTPGQRNRLDFGVTLSTRLLGN